MPFDPKNWNDFDGVYYREIDKYALQSTNFVVDNSNPKHALYLINKLFLVATKSIKIFSNSLIPSIEHRNSDGSVEIIDIYSHEKVIQNALHFLAQPNRKLEIIVENKIDETNNKLYKALINEKSKAGYGGNLSVRVIDKALVNGEELSNHFMIADSKAYRLEKEKHTDSFTAWANFGDGDFSSKIADYFSGYLTPISKHIA